MEIDVTRLSFQPPDMTTKRQQILGTAWMSAILATITFTSATLNGAEVNSDASWRALSLITDGKVDTNWIHVGWGGFVVDDGTLRTDPAAKGLGLLVYQKERLGNCQIRVVFKTKEAKCNSGVYVRLADGILAQVGKPGAAFDRDAAGNISKASMELVKESGERDEGPWYAVHHGYEVQIADTGDAMHRTGAIYSLTPSSANVQKPGVWRTMVITLAGERISAELDGRRVSFLDLSGSALPPRTQWHEPKREPKRPEAGYIGLQNHDPGDIVWFKEVSVRPVPSPSAR